MNYSFDLVVTSTGKQIEFSRLCESLSNQFENIKLRLLFVNQGNKIDLSNFKDTENFKILSVKSNLISLSAARNLAISIGLKSDIVGFPDDDCWYSDSALRGITNKFIEFPEADCICTNVYDPIKNVSYGNRPIDEILEINYANIFKLPISVGIFIRRNAFESIGSKFDEAFGIGSMLGSGEETLLISQLLDRGCRVMYCGDVKIYHEIPNIETVQPDKQYSYGLGYGYLVSHFVKNKNYIVLFDLFRTLLGSLLGFFVYLCSNFKRSKFYISRFKGILSGIIKFIQFRDHA